MTNPTITTGSNLTDEQWLNNAYLNTFGRSAVTGAADTGGGAQYWLDQMASDPTGHSRANVLNALQQSAEGKSFANDGVVRPGGVNRGASTVSQADNEYLQSISSLGLNNANVLNNIAANSFLAATDGSGAQTTDNVAGGYFQLADNDITGGDNTGGGDTGGGDTGGGDTGGGDTGSTNWWDQYSDIDAFKDALGLGTQQQSGGMDDFMKFMMFMSMMRPQGGGYGGSQYGYGGLNPGGVMSAYNPLDNITSAISAFQSLPGIGTNLTNTGAAGGNSGN